MVELAKQRWLVGMHLVCGASVAERRSSFLRHPGY